MEINDEIITAEMIKELTTIIKTGNISHEQLLNWAKRVEAQTTKKEMFTNIQENVDFEIKNCSCMKPNNKNMSYS